MTPSACSGSNCSRDTNRHIRTKVSMWFYICRKLTWVTTGYSFRHWRVYLQFLSPWLCRLLPMLLSFEDAWWLDLLCKREEIVTQCKYWRNVGLYIHTYFLSIRLMCKAHLKALCLSSRCRRIGSQKWWIFIRCAAPYLILSESSLHSRIIDPIKS